MAGKRRHPLGQWISMRSKKRGRCDLCGRTFGVGERIRWDPNAYRVRCVGECVTIQPRQQSGLPKPEKPKRLPSHSQWQGEYVVLFDRGDYWFRKCVVCGRSFEGAAGRVAQAKNRGVCPACEETTPDEKVEALKEAALASDRARYRASHPASL
jgi:hypothetical protein